MTKLADMLMCLQLMEIKKLYYEVYMHYKSINMKAYIYTYGIYKPNTIHSLIKKSPKPQGRQIDITNICSSWVPGAC